MTANPDLGAASAHIARALELAAGGRGRVSPNPLVGCVVTDAAGGVIGEGFHAEFGNLHAERAALADVRARGGDPRGGTVYVTLEPCAHHGRQPPCADALIEAGVGRVVVASDDPSAKTAGRGPARLREAGIEVEWADRELAARARLLNQPFRKHARTGRPLVTLKSAVSLDGRTATASGDSRWISGPSSRALVHAWRAESDAIAVGIGTALADDPMLTARELGDRDSGSVRQPLRVVFDSNARLPLGSKLVGSAAEVPVLVFTGHGADRDRVASLSEAGVDVVELGPEDRIGAALDALGDRGVTSLMLEGGATLAGSFLDAGEIDRLAVFVAPLVLGGHDARRLLDGEGVATVADGRRAISLEVDRSGDDVLIDARLKEW